MKNLLQVILLYRIIARYASPKSVGPVFRKSRLNLTAWAEAAIHRWNFFSKVSLSSIFNFQVFQLIHSGPLDYLE